MTRLVTVKTYNKVPCKRCCLLLKWLPMDQWCWCNCLWNADWRGGKKYLLERAVCLWTIPISCGNNQLAVVLWASARNGGMGALTHVCVSWVWHWAACGWLIVSNCCQGCPLLSREQVLLWLDCMRKRLLEDLQLLIIWNLKGVYRSQEDEVIGK